MTLYSKNGSIPKSETDGSEGWIEVSGPPLANNGEEVIWWYPPGWVVRPIKPEPIEGYEWNWAQSSQQWISYALPSQPEVIPSSENLNDSTM